LIVHGAKPDRVDRLLARIDYAGLRVPHGSAEQRVSMCPPALVVLLAIPLAEVLALAALYGTDTLTHSGHLLVRWSLDPRER